MRNASFVPIFTAVSLVTVLVPGAAGAEEMALGASALNEPSLQLTYRAIYHAYQLRLFTVQDPSGHSPDLVRNVNPLYQTLDVGGYSLAGGDIDVVTQLRYATDFGTGFHRDTPNSLGIPATDYKNVFDILYLYMDWRNVIQDRLDVRIGRQLIMDDLAWYRLDGAKATIHLARSSTATIDVETYVGLPVRYDVLFSSPALIPDGYEALDGPGLAFGGAVFMRLFGDLSISAAYRQELTFRGNNIDVFRAPPNDATSADYNDVRSTSAGKYALEESGVGASIGYSIRPIHVDLFGHVTWNLVFGKPDVLRAGIAFNPERWLHVQVEGYEVQPLFAADSIFNVFNLFPYDRGRAEVSVEVLPGLLIEGGYFLLHVKGGPIGPIDPANPVPGPTAGLTYGGPEIAHGPSGGISYRGEAFRIGAYGEASTNTNGDYAFGGNYRRGEAFGDVSLFERRVGGVLRLGFTTIQNDWFNGAVATGNSLETGQVQTPLTSYYVDAGGRVVIIDGVKLNLNVVKNFKSYLEGDWRVLSVLEIRY